MKIHGKDIRMIEISVSNFGGEDLALSKFSLLSEGYITLYVDGINIEIRGGNDAIFDIYNQVKAGKKLLKHEIQTTK